MKNKLFVIGNGFDLAHCLPTRFNPDFKKISEKHEQQNFWELYQSREADIWSDFENLLRYPDFNTIEKIFDSYTPDYFSDKESDRDSIIHQVGLNGKLEEALYEFADKADKSLQNIRSINFFEKMLCLESRYITFNYTHTLEKIYGIQPENILHIHGEVGKNNLELGYPKEEAFTPETYSYDMSGRGWYIEMEMEDYIDTIEDYYVRTAYENIFDKCKSFYKETRIELLEEFLDKNEYGIHEIIIYGHSCAIDFKYFEYLNRRYSNAYWTFYVIDKQQEKNVKDLVKKIDINNIKIINIER